jgi:ABC-2 type transport system permease protein
MTTFKRLLRLWRLYGALDFDFLARGPQIALTYYVTDFIIGVATVTATFLLAARFDGIGPWSTTQVLFLLGYALLVRGLIDFFFNYNLALISRRIGRGQLDHVLIQPQPMWMAFLTEGFAPVTGSGMLVPGVALSIYAIVQTHIAITPAWLAVYALDVVSSIVIVLAFEYTWGSIAFWAPRAAEELNNSTWRLLIQLAPFPLDGLALWALLGLLSVVPVGLVAWYPARTLLGLDAPAYAPFVLPAAALVSAGLTTWIFTRGLRHYALTGSTRYLDYGHRR